MAIATKMMLVFIVCTITVEPSSAQAQWSTLTTCRGLPATIVGSPFDDVLTGTEGRDVIVGGAGADQINAGGGDDVVCPDEPDRGRPESGDDRVISGSGSDFVVASGGADTITDLATPSGGSDVLQGGAGNDGIFVEQGDDQGRLVADGGDANDTIEVGDRRRGASVNLSGGRGFDSISAGDIDESGPYFIDGGDGHDVIEGGDLNDGAEIRIEAGAGDDEITNGDADESGPVYIDAGGGDDDVFGGDMDEGAKATFIGGEGDDRIEAGDADEMGGVAMEGGGGDDTLRTGRTEDVEVSIDGGNGSDDVRAAGSSRGGRLLITGGRGNDTLDGGRSDLPDGVDIFGNEGDDNILGSEGSERIDGGDGVDDIQGNDGADDLRGGNGADTLDGGPGADAFHGGRGDDRLLALDSAMDTVFDCGPGEDGVEADQVWDSAVERVACERTISPRLTPCGDAVVIGVRGSGDNEDGLAWPGRHALEVAKQLRDRYGLTLYDGDHVASLGGDRKGDRVIGLRYPAVSVPTSIPTGDYTNSVHEGTDALLNRINAIRSSGVCGGELPILLLGYSQGAHVIQDALDRLAAASDDGDAKGIAGVALLASPRFDGSDPSARGTFLGDSDFPTGGLAGGEEVPDEFTSKTRTYCVAEDSVCLMSPTNVIRTERHSNGYDAGTDLLADAIGHFAWRVKVMKHEEAPPRVVGSLRVFGSGIRFAGDELMYVDAASIYARGASTETFEWDFESDGGESDHKSTSPWALHSYGLSWIGRSAIAKTTVRITHQDKTMTVRAVCIRRTLFGSGTTPCPR